MFSVLTHFWACNPGTPWWRKRELVTDICYWFFVPLFARVLRIGLLVLGAGVVFKIHDADELIAFYDNGHGPLSELPLWLQALLFLVLSDFMLYWLHRMFHGGGFWKYHAIHHSSEDLDWISAARFHPVNLFLGTIAVDVILLMAGISPNIMLWVGPFTTFHSAFVHANLNWTLGPFKYVLATPVFHRWHHTALEEGGNTNFAGTFPIWDILFGTFRMPENELPESLWRGRAGDPVRDRRAIGLSVPAIGLQASGFSAPFAVRSLLASDLPRRAPVPLRIALAGLSTPRGIVCRSVPCVRARARLWPPVAGWPECCCGRPSLLPTPRLTPSRSMSIRPSWSNCPPASPPSWSETR